MRRIKRIAFKPKSLWVLISLLLVILGQQLGWFDKAQQAATTNQPGLYSVTGFNDGDTITVNMNGSQEIIRFVGVDTPETQDPRKAVQCYGKAAATFTKNLIGSNPVRLEADPLGTNRDRYNRLLRYVYLPNNTLVNAEIIRQGYGFAYTSFPLTKADEFKDLENQASTSKRGLWGDCAPFQNQYGGFTSNDE